MASTLLQLAFDQITRRGKTGGLAVRSGQSGCGSKQIIFKWVNQVAGQVGLGWVRSG